MKVIRITTNAASLKVFEATCIKQHDCKKALECGTFELVLPVKQDMTAVTENLENEPFQAIKTRELQMMRMLRTKRYRGGWW